MARSPSDSLLGLVTHKSGTCWYREARCWSSGRRFIVACAPAIAVEDRNTRSGGFASEARSVFLDAVQTMLTAQLTRAGVDPESHINTFGPASGPDPADARTRS